VTISPIKYYGSLTEGTVFGKYSQKKKKQNLGFSVMFKDKEKLFSILLSD
jgi:hypothetical protein